MAVRGASRGQSKRGAAAKRERSRKDVSIRRATNDDAREILDCLAAAFAPFRNQYTPAGYLDTVLTPETIAERMASMTILVAVDDGGRVIGTIAFRVEPDGDSHIRGMAIHPAWQGSGVALRLLDAAQSELRDRGCTRITLDTTAPLARAIRFYERQGFRFSGKIGDYYGMPLFEYVKTL